MRHHRLTPLYLIAVVLLVANCRPTEVADFPTLAVLPTLVPTVTETGLPTSTLTPSLTPTQTLTYTPSLTITMTRTPDASQTLRAAHTPTAEVNVMQSTVYYALNTANVLSCPQQNCTQVGQLQYGTPIVVTGIVEGDDVHGGNRFWYRVNFRDETAYIYSALIVQTLPSAITPVSPLNFSPMLVPTTSSVTCPDINAFCSALTCAQAYACVRAGAPNIDGDHDGRPCERQCGG